ncbi:MAG: hypothetical protein RSC43_03475, partial [Clostridia bacterium]
RQVACDEDLAGFRAVAEQFLLENPGVSKWNGVNSPQQLEDAFHLFDSDYLEGEMKIVPTSVGVSGNMYLTGRTARKDPWGEPYTLVMTNQKLAANGVDCNSFFNIIVRSTGANTSYQTPHPCMFYSDDNDDIVCTTQFSTGKVASKVFTSKDLHYYGNYGYDYQLSSWGWLNTANIPGYELG